MRNLKLFVLVLVFIQMLTAKPITIKFATLAPEGSTWIKVMMEFRKAVLEATDGQVKFKVYAGGIQGDEKDVLRKIQINQLQSGGFTGVGLGAILPEVRVLDGPFLFQSYDEVDSVNMQFFKRFSKKFEERGFILLGWTEVGFVYIYTNREARKLDDFKNIKMWMWEGDPLAEATFQAFGIHPIPLSITDVLTSLQTGLIDGVYTSPMACVGLQWFTKIKYMLDLPLADSHGAVLVSKRMFNKLSARQQKIVRQKSTLYFNKLTQLSRKDNRLATQQMVKNGLQKIEVSDPALLKDYQQIGSQARRLLVGKLYSKELLEQVEQAVRDFRVHQKEVQKP